MKKIGFIGVGNMAEAMIDGMLQSGEFSSEQILVTNKNNSERLKKIQTKFNVEYFSKKKLVEKSDVLIIAVKPQDLKDVLLNIKNFIKKDILIISVVAGVDIESIINYLGKKLPIIRAMPNTSARVNYSATAMAVSKNIKDEEVGMAHKILSCVGTVHLVEENNLDAVTGLSGSGPAYVYSFINAMIKGGEEQGLSHELSEKLAFQTLRGALEMITVTGSEIDELIVQICSPNGTTVAGLGVLKETFFEDNIKKAISTATNRSKQLCFENKVGIITPQKTCQ